VCSYHKSYLARIIDARADAMKISVTTGEPLLLAIYPTSAAASRRIQLALFEMGIYWREGQDVVIHPYAEVLLVSHCSFNRLPQGRMVITHQDLISVSRYGARVVPTGITDIKGTRFESNIVEGGNL